MANATKMLVGYPIAIACDGSSFLTVVVWDGQQMVYGDGGRFLYNFTGSLDVIAHELSHGVTDYTSPLEYVSQSGALNEHMSDAFGIMAKHYDLQVKSQDDDWLIGEEILLPGVKGVALRSMKAPGTAYNDPRFVSR